MKEGLKDYFVFYKPKDIVAGDFYWASALNGSFIYLTGDSTGHGIPGAFVSLLNISKMSETVNQKKILRPDLVLNSVRMDLIKALNPEGSTEECKDGMDCILCRITPSEMKLEYSAANNSFYIIRNGHAIICKADKMPVGKSTEDTKPFTYNQVQLMPGDVVYTFTDGFADQFGGAQGKKFKREKLKELLCSIYTMPMSSQKEIIAGRFEEWKGSLEQVDDVLIMGVRV
jgi:serine phosphatase RsbU (regulator of sigma subunit)